MTIVNKPTAELKPYDKNANCVGSFVHNGVNVYGNSKD